MEEMRILSPTAILGYGFPTESFQRGLDKNPDLIAVDAGSIDPGPYYLGAGKPFTDRQAVKRDLELILTAGQDLDIPVVIGTAGGSGGRPHLNWCAEIIKEIAEEKKLNFPLAEIGAEVEKSRVQSGLEQDQLTSLAEGQPLSSTQIKESTRIVAQMGVEPIIKSLDQGAEVVLAGRAYDPTVFAAPAIKAGFPAGLAYHLGKILECASIAATPGSGSDSMFAILREDHFILEPMNPKRCCTETSVAAHTLYEKENPVQLVGPGGTLNLEATEFEQLDDRRVKVTGSKFIPADKYQVKLEGAKLVGYRTIAIAGTRDPIMIKELDNTIKEVKQAVRDNFSDLSEDDYYLVFRVYGKNGVMGDLEPEPEIKGDEVGIVIEAVANQQSLADTICSFARSTMLHYGYSGRVATAGNLAFPYSPSDFSVGEVYEFNIHHLLEITEPCELFPVDINQVCLGGDND